MPVRVLLDIPRPRVTRTPITLKSDGRVWDLWNSSGIYLDPVTLTAFLLPRQLDPLWETTYTGSYARKRLTDFQKGDGSALTAADWKENPYRDVGDWRLENRGVNYAVFYPGLPQNAPVFLSFFVYSGSKQAEAVIECGWGEIGAPGTVSLRVRGSGRCEVYKGTEFLADYSISGASVEVQRLAGQAQASGQGAGVGAQVGAPGASDVLGRVVNLYMLPMRRREIVVFGSAGGGFSHVFSDLDPEASVNTITPAGRFWWRVAQGKASVQFAPMTFPASGYVLGPTYTLREPPQTGEAAAFLVADDGPGYGGAVTSTPTLRAPDGVTPFAPDGTADEARIRVDLAGDGTNTPYLYAVDANFDPLFADTADAGVDISDNLQRIGFFVPEDPFGVRGDFRLRGPDEMSGAGIVGIDTQSGGRPFRIEVKPEGGAFGSGDWSPFITGITGEPKRTEAPVVGANDRARVVELDWRDLSQQLDDLLYEDEPAALDDLDWKDAVETPLYVAGIPSAEWDVEDILFRLPFTTAVSKGEWSFDVKAGDRASDVLRNLFRSFAASYYAGFSPVAFSAVPSGVRFRVNSPAGLGLTPKARLYLDAVPPASPANYYVARDFQERRLPPEATRVTVLGFDPRRQVYLRGRQTAPTLEDPTTAPNLRPDGWVGTVRPVEIRDYKVFTTQGAVVQATDEYFARLAVSDRIAEWNSPLLLGPDGIALWRGDVVRVVGWGRYRIESFSGSFEREGDGFTFRRVDYVARRVAAET